MEQLQLQVESRLFEQDEKGLAEMIGLLGIDEDLAGKSKIRVPKGGSLEPWSPGALKFLLWSQEP